MLRSFHGGEKQGERKRDSVFLARILRNEIKKWSSNEKVLVIKSEVTYGSGQWSDLTCPGPVVLSHHMMLQNSREK